MGKPYFSTLNKHKVIPEKKIVKTFIGNISYDRKYVNIDYLRVPSLCFISYLTSQSVLLC